MLIIGLAGKKQAGKTSTATYLQQEWVSQHIWVTAYADELKAVCRKLFGLSIRQTDGSEAEKNSATGVTHPVTKKRLTVRELLQYFGTDVVRRMDPDAWVRAAEYTWDYLAAEVSPDILFVTDVRFPNEVEAIQKQGGRVIYLTRGLVGDGHESENGFSNLDYFDAVLDNTAMNVAEQAFEVAKLVRLWQREQYYQDI